MRYSIYVLHNVCNNKIYIGKSNDPYSRIKEHIRIANGGFSKYPRDYFLIHRAIRKYGMKSFVFQIIEDYDEENDCFEAEKFWIEFFRSWDRDYGYNLTLGGDGPSGAKRSEETKNKIRKSLLALPKGKDHHMFGKTFPIETRRKMSHAKRKLTDKQINDIVSMLSLQTQSQKEIAAQYNVNQSVISRIKKKYSLD